MTNSKEYSAKYYQEHRQEIVERKKKHYEENKEERLRGDVCLFFICFSSGVLML